MIHHSIKTNYPTFWYTITRARKMIDDCDRILNGVTDPTDPIHIEIKGRRASLIEMLTHVQTDLINAMAKE